MRRALSIASVLIAAFAAGFVFMLVEFEFLFHFLGPMLIRASAMRAGLWTLVLPLCFVASRGIVRRRGWLASAIGITLICFFAAVLAETAYLTYLAGHNGLRRPHEREAHPPSEIMEYVLTSVHAPFSLALSCTMLVSLVGARADERERDVKVNRLESRLSEARLHLLRSQLHPHFLFNSLNSVSALIRNDRSGAKKMLQQLSRFYSVTQATEGRHVITVAEELLFVREYADIEQIRFGPRLVVDISADKDALSRHVPTLILQPLVENAIKHGVARTPGPGWIRVHAVSGAHDVELTVEDNGCWLEGGDRGVGLENTHARLQNLYGPSYEFRIEPIDAGGWRVYVRIPEVV